MGETNSAYVIIAPFGLAFALFASVTAVSNAAVFSVVLGATGAAGVIGMGTVTVCVCTLGTDVRFGCVISAVMIRCCAAL